MTRYDHIYGEISDELYDLLRKEAKSLSDDLLGAMAESVSGDSYESWNIPEKVDLMHLEIDNHYLLNKSRFDKVFGLKPVYQKVLDLKDSTNLLEKDSDTFAAVRVLSDLSAKEAHKRLILMTDNIIGRIRSMPHQERVNSEELIFIERLSATKIIEASASVARLGERDIEGLALESITHDTAKKMSTPSRTWEKRLSEEKSLIGFLCESASIDEQVMGKDLGESKEFLISALEEVPDFAAEFAAAVIDRDHAIETSPLEHLIDKGENKIISDIGVVTSAMTFKYSSDPKSYKGLALKDMGGNERLDLLSTALSKFCVNSSYEMIENEPVSKERVVEIMSETEELARNLLDSYGERFRIKDLKQDQFKDEVISFTFLKAAITSAKDLDLDRKHDGEGVFLKLRDSLGLEKMFAARSEIAPEELAVIENHHGISLSEHKQEHERLKANDLSI